jgi:hypothetical protein
MEDSPMKLFIICSGLVVSLFLGTSTAGELKEIVLQDGSIISGEVMSLNKSIYTIKSDALGTIKIEETKIRSIQEKTLPTSVDISARPTATTGEIKSLEEKMMSDKEIMNLILTLQNDPDFKKLMEDPKIMQAVNAGDVATLTSDARFMKLLNNKTVQEIQKKVK